MDLNLHIPDEIVEALGPEPEREALEGMLVLLVGEGKMTLERAGEVLGLEGRKEVVRWYTARTQYRPNSEVGEVGGLVFLEDLTRESRGRSKRFLKIRPSPESSGLSDVSINHDKYLAEDC
jgi:hypothetical protein